MQEYAGYLAWFAVNTLFTAVAAFAASIVLGVLLLRWIGSLAGYYSAGWSVVGGTLGGGIGLVVGMNGIHIGVLVTPALVALWHVVQAPALGWYRSCNPLTAPLAWAAIAFVVETRLDVDMATPSPIATLAAIALVVALVAYLASQPGSERGWPRIWLWERIGLAAGAAVMWVPGFNAWFAFPPLACAALAVGTHRVPISGGYRGTAIGFTVAAWAWMVLGLIQGLSR